MKHFSGFDLLAPVYDLLARLVFGKSIIRAQTCNLRAVTSPPTNVLIVGGGTGWILKDLHKVHGQSSIWYFDTSIKMINRARRNSRFPDAHFVCGQVRDLPPVKFDLVITNFFFDMFRTSTTRALIDRIRTHMAANGVWMVAEFRSTSRPDHRLLLFLMYRFFRVLCRIEASRLPDWERVMKSIGMKRVAHRLFYAGMIQSDIFAVA